MKKDIKNFSLEIGGRELKVETGRLANQTNGSCSLQYGDSVVLATACMSDSEREGIDFFPLMVDYDEKLYAAGKIKGSRFIKREGRPADEAILSGRLVDRSIRPLFNQEMRRDVQTVLSVLSFDNENDPDIMALNAASVALSISDIPWDGPVAAVRVGRIKSSSEEGVYEWVLNPTYEARKKSDLDLVVVSREGEVVMLEAGANEVGEDIMYEAIQFGKKHTKKIIDFIKQIQTEIGLEKQEVVPEKTEEEKQEIEMIKEKVNAIINKKDESFFINKTKEDFQQKINSLKSEVDEVLKQDNEVSKLARAKAGKMVEEFLDSGVKNLVLKNNKRIDGRQINEVRELEADVQVLPRTHGSGLFRRGETQVMSIVTLGSPSDEQTLDTMEEEGKKRYMHHYNFPSFSVGEVGPMRGPGRREIGHGALAEKALIPVLPDKENFPYTIRVVSEVLSSNGSTSQASICGSTLSLMDAGVPIKAPVAGIAMGLITNPEDKNDFKVLTDIQGVEDHSGDMDFKVAGTKNGITAIQLDIKLHGIDDEVVEQTLKQAKEARLKILEVMAGAIAEPNKELSPYAPRIYTFKIDPEKIRDVIGPGGKVINQIIDETGVTIDIEDDGMVIVTSNAEEAAQKALEWIKNITREVVAGEKFSGKVTRLMDFGAFVEILPGQEGLVHISEMAPFRVGKVTDVVSIGDIVPVVVKEIDEQGRINLSMKGTDFDFSKIKREETNNNGGFNGRRNNFNRSDKGFNNRNNNKPNHKKFV